MKKKNPPLSFDQKKVRLLGIIQDMKDVSNLKEMEKIGPKHGIVLQSIKEILDSLVGDSLVENDKIGSANFIWSLPSNKINTLSQVVVDQEGRIGQVEGQVEQYQQKIEKAKEGREASEERSLLLEEYQALQTSLRMNSVSLQDYRNNDPRRFLSIKQSLLDKRAQVEKMTDDISEIKRWMISSNGNLDHHQLNEYFSIPDGFDEIV